MYVGELMEYNETIEHSLQFVIGRVSKSIFLTNDSSTLIASHTPMYIPGH